MSNRYTAHMHQETKLTIILTSYNRPFFVRRAIESMLAQTCPDWRLIIQDDGSNPETLQAIYAYSDRRITVIPRTVSQHERTAVSRYAYLINLTYPVIQTPYVGYMCDNVEYKPNMVREVIDFFENNPSVWSGYILHNRDAWTVDGVWLGNARLFGHWDFTPPEGGEIANPFGLLDHSQVFHRLPIASRWEEGIDAVACGDGIFFTRLVYEHGPIAPISRGQVLSVEHLFK